MKSLKMFVWHCVAIPTYFSGFIPFNFLYGPMQKLVDKLEDWAKGRKSYHY
jgi:hypothetical protein